MVDIAINTAIADAFEKGMAQRAARAAEQPTRYERMRDRFIANVRLFVAQQVAEFAGADEIDQAVSDAIYGLQVQHYLPRLRGHMMNPSETSLASAVIWAAERRENDPNPVSNAR
jgi:hypothetical protein